MASPSTGFFSFFFAGWQQTFTNRTKYLPMAGKKAAPNEARPVNREEEVREAQKSASRTSEGWHRKVNKVFSPANKDQNGSVCGVGNDFCRWWRA